MYSSHYLCLLFRQAVNIRNYYFLHPSPSVIKVKVIFVRDFLTLLPIRRILFYLILISQAYYHQMRARELIRT